MGETSQLALLALAMSAISLIISTWSMWPSCKDGLARVRDAVLWVAFIFVLVGCANYYWRARARDFSGNVWRNAPWQLTGEALSAPRPRQRPSSRYYDRPEAGSPGMTILDSRSDRSSQAGFRG